MTHKEDGAASHAVEREHELLVGTGMSLGACSEAGSGDGGDEAPERPTSAPPTLDMADGLFPGIISSSTSGNAEKAILGSSPEGAAGDHSPRMNVAVAAEDEDTFPSFGDGTGSTFSPSHGVGMGPFASRGFSSGYEQEQQDPRTRTESIEQFLAQSPGSIFGPRKKYVPPPSSSSSSNVPRLGSDDPMQFINMESPGHALKGLRKRLDALDLKDDMDRQLYYQQQQEKEYQVSPEESLRPSLQRSHSSTPRRSPLSSPTPRPEQLQQSAHSSPQSHTQPETGFWPTHQQQQPTQQHVQQVQMNYQQIYEQNQSSPLQMPSSYDYCYYPQQYMQSPPAYGYSPQQVYMQQGHQAQEYEGMQKIILPNGLEAMVVPMVQQTHWSHGSPPPPPTAASDYDVHAGGHETTTSPNERRGGIGRGKRQQPHGNGSRRGGNNNNRNPQSSPTGGDPSIQIMMSAPLREYEGRIFQLSQQQQGCRFLQQKVDEEGRMACQMILNEVGDRLSDLMMDPFGNYLFQKLLEHANVEQRDEMLSAVQSHLYKAARNLHGTRSVQKFVEVTGGPTPTPHQLDQIIRALSSQVTELSTDTNGNHVIQRCLQYIPNDSISFVYDTVVRDVIPITKHRHGCCVFQRCIDAADPRQRLLLVDEVVKHAIELMQDPYSNYVVQYVLEHAKEGEARRIVEQLHGKLTLLSTQKFSSNVVEKCLATATKDELQPLIEQLCESETTRKLLNDSYGNYVVQRALQEANDEQGRNVVHAIRPHMNSLASSNSSCARRVASRVVKRFPELASDEIFGKFCSREQPQHQ